MSDGDSEKTQHPRKFERISDTLHVSYHTAESAEPSFTETYDIGRGGCAILTNAELSEGQPLSVELELRESGVPPLRLSAAVRWSQYDRLLNRWRTGVEFLDRSSESDAELQRYIETLRRLRDMGVL